MDPSSSTNAENAKKELEFNVGRLRLAEAEKTKVQGLRIQLDNVQTELQKKEDVAAKAERERRELEEANLKLLEEAGKLLQNHKSEHPTLGMLVADMGHKLIYRANPITLLAQTQVWRKQRAFRPVGIPLSHLNPTHFLALSSPHSSCAYLQPWRTHFAANLVAFRY